MVDFSAIVFIDVAHDFTVVCLVSLGRGLIISLGNTVILINLLIGKFLGSTNSG